MILPKESHKERFKFNSSKGRGERGLGNVFRAKEHWLKKELQMREGNRAIFRNLDKVSSNSGKATFL